MEVELRRLVLVLLLTQNNGICKVNNNKQQEPCLATLLSWKLEASKKSSSGWCNQEDSNRPKYAVLTARGYTGKHCVSKKYCWLPSKKFERDPHRFPTR